MRINKFKLKIWIQTITEFKTTAHPIPFQNNRNTCVISNTSLFQNLNEGRGDGSTGDHAAALVVDLDTDGGLGSGSDALEGGREVDHVVTGRLRASSSDGEAGVSVGQGEVEGVFANNDFSAHRQGSDGSINVDADEQGHGLADLDVAGNSSAFRNGETGGSGKSAGGSLGSGAQIEGDGVGHGGSHEAGDQEELEHGGGPCVWIDSLFTTKV